MKNFKNSTQYMNEKRQNLTKFLSESLESSTQFLSKKLKSSTDYLKEYEMIASASKRLESAWDTFSEFKTYLLDTIVQNYECLHTFYQFNLKHMYYFLKSNYNSVKQ